MAYHLITKTLISVAILSLGACSGGFGTMNGIMASWKGAPLDEVISQWGYPSDQQTIAGRKLYHWRDNRRIYTPPTTTGTVNAIGSTAYVNTTTVGGGYSNWSCTRTLEVNKNNIVTGAQ